MCCHRREVSIHKFSVNDKNNTHVETGNELCLNNSKVIVREVCVWGVSCCFCAEQGLRYVCPALMPDVRIRLKGNTQH